MELIAHYFFFFASKIRLQKRGKEQRQEQKFERVALLLNVII
ncbi:hypothetical protein M899_0888 [Bacteriovorax sp. BSW11_IV]|nr:hypothetical protein M899_0888 [Bacteriovorax sp. BSW11_IV]